MKKRWYQFATADERWTLANWFVFLAVTGVFFACFWLVAGPGWLHFMRLTFGATVEILNDGAPDSASVLNWFGMIALFLPLVLATIPAMAVLLGISSWLKSREPQDES